MKHDKDRHAMLFGMLSQASISAVLGGMGLIKLHWIQQAIVSVLMLLVIATLLLLEHKD